MGGFCPSCGAILPLPPQKENTVPCFACKTNHKLDVYGSMKTDYTIFFNQISTSTDRKDASKPEADGPTVRRKCPSCGNSKMSYATLQLRSADEGQTVFYTCTKCKFKETENS